MDHLPASPTVPTPEKVLGYIVGDPGHLTYSKDLYRYYRELARVSSRVHVFTAPEHSEEGKEQLLVVISDKANLAQLDHYKEITAKLADPRHVTAPEAQSLIAVGKPFYWVSGSIHSTETGSPEMLMELDYRLTVADLTEPMNLLTTDVKITGKVTGAATPVAYVINHNAESALMPLRYRLKSVTIQVAERDFKLGSQSYNAGSFVIPTTHSPADLPARLQSAVSELGLTATAVDVLPTLKSRTGTSYAPEARS